MALFKKRTVGKPGEWYYCLEHKKVEEGPECPAQNRFGPYTSREAAQHAMDTARERNLEWDTDPKWHDEDKGKGTPGPSGGNPSPSGD
ncbi:MULTISPECIES: hypothetical protein [Streptomyces]|uniref:SPOR domain-containing protein n=1 Tax=Streptomyces anulatus TaxID=1892 RepID=A0A7K3RLD7_STRAQ|nr:MULTISPECIES: hypothetical protein [Streptomyces]NEC02998.1 hypothetical protein [Streptomyces anulatus]NED26752.1 hypothetical protein [Streptomyces anulatus]OWA20184.1 hypothetical protein B9W61_27145 [Streptomyces sp. CS057]